MHPACKYLYYIGTYLAHFIFTAVFRYGIMYASFIFFLACCSTFLSCLIPPSPSIIYIIEVDWLFLDFWSNYLGPLVKKRCSVYGTFCFKEEGCQRQRADFVAKQHVDKYDMMIEKKFKWSEQITCSSASLIKTTSEISQRLGCFSHAHLGSF